VQWRSITLVLVLVETAVAVTAYVMNGDQPRGSVYGNLATSDWERELADWDVECPPCGTGGYTRWVSRRPSVFANLCDDFGIPDSREYPTFPLVGGDPNALPVLMELFKSPDPKARRVAIEGVRRIGDRAEVAAPLLRAALRDSDPDVSGEAAIVLLKWDKDLVLRWLAGKE
jgi:hypothetical protein